MDKKLMKEIMKMASIGGLLDKDEYYGNKADADDKEFIDSLHLSDKDQELYNNCLAPLIMLEWAYKRTHYMKTAFYVKLQHDTERFKKEHLAEYPNGSDSAMEDSGENPFFWMAIENAPDSEYDTYVATIQHLIEKKKELDKKYPNRREELQSGKLSEEETLKRVLIDPRRDYKKDKFWKYKGQKMITEEQYQKIQDSYITLLNKNFRPDEYVDSRAYRNFLKENFNVDYDMVKSFDPLATSSEILKADETQKAEIMDSITEKKASEILRALEGMNAHMDQCIKAGKPETFADIKGDDVRIWFEKCKMPVIVRYDVEKTTVINSKGQEEIRYTKLEPNILQFIDFYQSDKFDPDLNSEFSQADIDVVMNIYKSDEAFYKEELAYLYEIRDDANRNNGAQVYQHQHFERMGEEEYDKFNRFRSALFNIKLKDENTLKLGNDNNPIYTTKFQKGDKLSNLATMETETKMVRACQKMLNDARQSRNSKAYDKIQTAITYMEDVIQGKEKAEGKSQEVLYTEAVEQAIIAIGKYYMHKALHGETTKSTEHKYPVIQRIEKVLMDRYHALTDKTFLEDHPAMADFYNTEKAVKDKEGNLLKGDEYVRSISKQRVKNVNRMSKEFENGKSKLSEKTFKTKEHVIQRSNSVKVISK